MLPRLMRRRDQRTCIRVYGGGTTILEGRAPTPKAPNPRDRSLFGVLDLLDVPVFVTALLDPVVYQTQYPNCDPYGADFNIDGSTDALDIQLFEQALLNP